MGVGYNPKIVTANLIFCTDAGNIKSYPKTGSTIVDVTNSQNQLVFANGATYNTIGGGSILLDGVDDYVLLNNNGFTDNVNSMTITLWAYRGDWYNVPKANSANYEPMVSKMADYNSGAGWDFAYGLGRRLSILVQEAGGNKYFQYLTPPISAANNAWLSFTASFSSPLSLSAVYDLYVNDQPQGPLVNISAGGLFNSFATTANVCFGARNTGMADPKKPYFTGNIACVMIYDRKLSNTEIQQNFNALRGRFGV